jgi:hypothetical protein
MEMSTSAETGVEPDPSTTDTTNDGVRPLDGSMPSAHAEPATGLQPHDGSMPSAHTEPAIGVQPHDGSMPSAHVERTDVHA